MLEKLIQNHQVGRSLLLLLLMSAILMLLAGATMQQVLAGSNAAPFNAPTADPEAVITGFTPRALVRNQSHLFIASGGHGAESCQFNPALTSTVLRRVNFDGTGSVSLLQRCTFFLNGMVVDENYVYIKDGDLDLKRISVNGGSLQTIAQDVGGCCGLAMDDTHLYWAKRESNSTNNGLFRVLKTGGAVEQLASIPNGDNIYFIRDLAVDATHLYWTEGKSKVGALNQPGVGSVRKISKAGGAPQTLADIGDGIQNPGDIEVDATHVYWSEHDTARARRVGKNGGAVEDHTATQPGKMGQSLALSGSDVYWTDTDAGYAGRLRRAAKEDNTATDLAVGILGPGKPLLTNSHVYWSQSGGVYRLPLGSGEVAIDFRIEAVEVVQAIQNLNNDVPLVAEKLTLVRVYPRVDLITGQTPKVQLRGFRNGVELDWSPLQPAAPNVPILKNGADRSRLDHTFNFYLPEHWREGTVTLEAEINPGQPINELKLDNNVVTVMANFQAKKPLCIEVVRVRTAIQTASTSDPGFYDMVDWVEGAYPVPAVLIDAGGTIEEAGGPYELSDDNDDTNKILARLGWYRLWHDHNQWQKCGAAHFFGMVHPTAQSAGGIGYRPGWAAWGVTLDSPFNDTIGEAAPWYAPHGGATMAHEVGHNRGRKHVDCGDPDGTDDNYPYSPCDLSVGFPGSHWGFDYLDKAVIGSDEAGDLMSYSMNLNKPRWPSDYTYKAIFNEIPDANLLNAASTDQLALANYATAESAALAQNLLTADQVLLVSALLTPTANSAVFDQLSVVPSGTITNATLIDSAATTLVNPNGAYKVRLLDAADAVLGEIRFDLPDSDGPPGYNQQGASFVLAMPYAEQTARVVLLHNEVEITSRTASPNVPTVKVLEPNGGEAYAGSITVRWESKEGDGDPLSFMVQYSHDNGATWRVLASETFSTSITLTDTTHLPGTNGFSGHVRVFANDGLHTTIDTSDRPFSLRKQPPVAHISNPEEGEIVAYGETLGLVGEAYDAEDGQVAPANLQWILDDKVAGSGAELAVNGLTVGKHTVTLLAVDSGNMTGVDSRTFIVQKQYCTDNDNRLDLVFVIDNSPQMAQHAANFCAALPGMIKSLTEMGVTVNYTVLDVAASSTPSGKSACATGNVQTMPDSGINHPADWGKAVATVAANRDWLADTTRIIVPVTNQGAEDGNPVADPGDDRSAIEAAIEGANAASAAVFPLMMPPADSLNFVANMQLADELANATQGRVIQWSSEQTKIAAYLQEGQAQLGCTPEVDFVEPPIAANDQEICIVGRNLWVGTTVSVGAKPATTARFDDNGALLCFQPDAESGTGNQPIRIERPGARPHAGKASVEIQPTDASFSIFLPLVTK